jgi:hypothetical protein
MLAAAAAVSVASAVVAERPVLVQPLVATEPLLLPPQAVAELPVLAQLLREPELVVLALLPVVLVVPAELPLAVADSVADSVAVRVQQLSRQSFSAAMARSTP